MTDEEKPSVTDGMTAVDTDSDGECWPQCKQDCYDMIFGGDNDSDGTDDTGIIPDIDCHQECDKRCETASMTGNDCEHEKCVAKCEGWNDDDIDTDPCETIDCGPNSFCEAFGGRAKCQCYDNYVFAPASDGKGKCVCMDESCIEATTTKDPTTEETRPTLPPVRKCDISILGEQVKAYCSLLENDVSGAQFECGTKCLEPRLITYFNDQIVEGLICRDGELYLTSFEKPIIGTDVDTMPVADLILVDGPLQCRKPELDLVDVIDVIEQDSPCNDESTYRCPRNAKCESVVGAAVNGPSYTCKCETGFVQDGKSCIEEKPIVNVHSDCPDSFKKGLKKLKVSDVKKPTRFAGTKSLIMEIQTQMKMLPLNYKTYTAFLEFNPNNCGNEFVRAVAEGQVQFGVYDAMGSKGLYTVAGSYGVFYKNQKGSTATGGAVVQISKNFPTLAAMTGDETMFEINQEISKKTGKIVPARDSFYLKISGDMVDPEEFEEYKACFAPENLQIFIDETKREDGEGYTVHEENWTKCFYKSKLANEVDVTCKKPAIINGKPTEAVDLMTVLFESDFHECVANKE